MLPLTLLMLIPNRISVANSMPILDAEYFFSRISFLFATIPAIILFFIMAVQRTTFYSEGLFYKGQLLAWSDFQTYSWNNRSKKNDVQEISLVTAQNVWTPRQIKLIISSDNEEKVESILAQRLKKSESE